MTVPRDYDLTESHCNLPMGWMSDAPMHVTTDAAPAPDSNVTSAAEQGDDNFSADRSSVYTLAATFLACSVVAPALVAGLADPLSR